MSKPTDSLAEEHPVSGHGADEVHVSPTWFYLTILGALITLTGATVWVSFLNLGWANDVAALGIAFTKASLVVLFFMHVKYSGRLIKFVVICAISWLSVLMGLTYLDYASRTTVQPDPRPVASEFQDLIDRGYGDSGTSLHEEKEEAAH